jgi:hypothetical protein
MCLTIWLLTKGRVLNTCVRGFGNQAMSVEVGMGADHARVWDVQD